MNGRLTVHVTVTFCLQMFGVGMEGWGWGGETSEQQKAEIKEDEFLAADETHKTVF